MKSVFCKLLKIAAFLKVRAAKGEHADWVSAWVAVGWDSAEYCLHLQIFLKIGSTL